MAHVSVSGGGGSDATTLDDPDSPMLAMIEQAAAHPQPTPPHTWEQQGDAMLLAPTVFVAAPRM